MNSDTSARLDRRLDRITMVAVLDFGCYALLAWPCSVFGASHVTVSLRRTWPTSALATLATSAPHTWGMGRVSRIVQQSEDRESHEALGGHIGAKHSCFPGLVAEVAANRVRSLMLGVWRHAGGMTASLVLRAR